MIIEGNKLIPENGLVLTNGETYSDMVFLGKFDKAENWHEVEKPEDEVNVVLSDKRL